MDDGTKSLERLSKGERGFRDEAEEFADFMMASPIVKDSRPFLKEISATEGYLDNIKHRTETQFTLPNGTIVKGLLLRKDAVLSNPQKNVLNELLAAMLGTDLNVPIPPCVYFKDIEMLFSAYPFDDPRTVVSGIAVENKERKVFEECLKKSDPWLLGSIVAFMRIFGKNDDHGHNILFSKDSAVASIDNEANTNQPHLEPNEAALVCQIAAACNGKRRAAFRRGYQETSRKIKKYPQLRINQIRSLLDDNLPCRSMNYSMFQYRQRSTKTSFVLHPQKPSFLQELAGKIPQIPVRKALKGFRKKFERILSPIQDI